MVEANIVRDYRIGNTRIKIADNYCKQTATEAESVVRRIAQQARQHISAAASTVENHEVQTAEKNQGVFPGHSGYLRCDCRAVACGKHPVQRSG